MPPAALLQASAPMPWALLPSIPASATPDAPVTPSSFTCTSFCSLLLCIYGACTSGPACCLPVSSVCCLASSPLLTLCIFLFCFSTLQPPKEGLIDPDKCHPTMSWSCLLCCLIFAALSSDPVSHGQG